MDDYTRDLTRLALVDSNYCSAHELLVKLEEKFLEYTFCQENKRKNECGLLKEECYYLIKQAKEMTREPSVPSAKPT